MHKNLLTFLFTSALFLSLLSLNLMGASYLVNVKTLKVFSDEFSNDAIGLVRLGEQFRSVEKTANRIKIQFKPQAYGWVDASSLYYLMDSGIYITASRLNVRAVPKGKKLGTVIRGQRFNVLEEANNWVKIKFNKNQLGWVSMDYIRVDAPATLRSKSEFCKAVNNEFTKLKWDDIKCDPSEWLSEMHSVKGNPLLYTVIGSAKTTTLLLCDIHPNEGTSYQCFHLLKMIKQNQTLINQRLVVIPLANPDGFLAPIKTRTNAHNVDLNRNFPTHNWDTTAIRGWARRYRKAPRLYPGTSANSEPESQFIIDLIQRFNPDKVMAIHAPLNFLDLDYPINKKESKNVKIVMEKAKVVALSFTKETKLDFYDYRTFPGSLGRFGVNWKLPIFTLELPSADPKQSKKLYNRFKEGLVQVFNSTLDEQRTVQLNDSANYF